MEHLASVQMTLDLLKATSVGRVVRRISKRREPALGVAAAKARRAHPEGSDTVELGFSGMPAMLCVARANTLAAVGCM